MRAKRQVAISYERREKGEQAAEETPVPLYYVLYIAGKGVATHLWQLRRRVNLRARSDCSLGWRESVKCVNNYAPQPTPVFALHSRRIGRIYHPSITSVPSPVPHGRRKRIAWFGRSRSMGKEHIVWGGIHGRWCGGNNQNNNSKSCHCIVYGGRKLDTALAWSMFVALMLNCILPTGAFGSTMTIQCHPMSLMS